MNPRCLLAAIVLLVPIFADGKEFKTGDTVDTAAQAMAAAGYHETMMQMMPGGLNSELRMWEVGQAVLIIGYSRTDRRISSMQLFICDERPKNARKSFTFPVRGFDPFTGLLTIEMVKPKNTRK